IPSVRRIANRKPLLVAAVDAVLDRLPARRIGLPAENHLAVGSFGGFQGHLHWLRRPARGEAPRLAPRAPDAAFVPGPDPPVVGGAGTQAAGEGPAVPRPAAIHGVAHQF